MQHIVSVAFDFDDKAVSEKIQATVEKAVIEKVTKDVETKIFVQGNPRTVSTDFLSSWTKNLIADIFEENKDVIIDRAAKYLADSYKRTKAWTSVVSEVVK